VSAKEVNARGIPRKALQGISLADLFDGAFSPNDLFVKEVQHELNKGFRFAVILAWQDLVKVSRPCSARVEYLCEPGAALDYVSVWSVRAGAGRDLVCDYWTWTSAAHPRGLRFRNGHRSNQLAQTLT